MKKDDYVREKGTGAIGIVQYVYHDNARAVVLWLTMSGEGTRDIKHLEPVSDPVIYNLYYTRAGLITKQHPTFNRAKTDAESCPECIGTLTIIDDYVGFKENKPRAIHT